MISSVIVITAVSQVYMWTEMIPVIKLIHNQNVKGTNREKRMSDNFKIKLFSKHTSIFKNT